MLLLLLMLVIGPKEMPILVSGKRKRPQTKIEST